MEGHHALGLEVEVQLGARLRAPDGDQDGKGGGPLVVGGRVADQDPGVAGRLGPPPGRRRHRRARQQDLDPATADLDEAGPDLTAGLGQGLGQVPQGALHHRGPVDIGAEDDLPAQRVEPGGRDGLLGAPW